MNGVQADQVHVQHLQQILDFKFKALRILIRLFLLKIL